ncbi:MAG: HPr(Ser) kinase/phosphatase [Candidatus Fibromonas sp.]|jgi:HPr kinase/phosphorylase|nr:HPr(Ser) kinase/phosphatase [Candidatus Fibromonas sp.]
MNYKDLSQIPEKTLKPLSVSELLKMHGTELKLSLKNEFCESEITSVDLHRPGLALAGFFGDYASEDIQLLGHTEWNFLESAGEENRKIIFSRLLKYKSPLWILTHGLSPHEELVNTCNTVGSPLVMTELPTINFARPLQRYLENYFARKIFLHGSMIDIFGVGTLFIGESGVGKSECVMDLVERGHCLVSDDAIDLRRIGNVILGAGLDGFSNCIEIRGIGIVDVRAMFGVKSVRDEKRLDIILELQKWDPNEQYSRTGLDIITNRILGMEIPHIVIPVIPGKNIAVVSEVVAMDHLLKMEGLNSSQNTNDLVLARIRQKMENGNKCAK